MSIRFTQSARNALAQAEQEAQRFYHEYIGTEHILLGLVKEGSGVAASVLKHLDLDLRKIRLEVEKIIQSGPGWDQYYSLGKLPHTPRAKKAIEYAIEEARNPTATPVDTEHLLLGLLREEEGVAAQILLNLGVTLENMRAEVRRHAVDPTWLRSNGGAVESLARGIAHSRRWADLPILADALEEAGCAVPDMLSHLRLGPAHGCRRGCWVVDRLLAAIPPEVTKRRPQFVPERGPPIRSRWRFWG